MVHLHYLPAAQYLSNTPGLRKTPRRCERGFWFCYFTDCTHTGIPQMLHEWLKQRAYSCAVVVDGEVNIHIWTNQPLPNCSPVICTIALLLISVILLAVRWIIRTERA